MTAKHWLNSNNIKKNGIEVLVLAAETFNDKKHKNHLTKYKLSD